MPLIFRNTYPRPEREGMSYDEKKELCGATVTLDGKRAAIAGARLRFAKVRQLPMGLEVEYAWETVQRIVAKGGQFRS